MRPKLFSARILKKLKRREEEIDAGKALVLSRNAEGQAEASGKNKKKTRVAA